MSETIAFCQVSNLHDSFVNIQHVRKCYFLCINTGIASGVSFQIFMCMTQKHEISLWWLRGWGSGCSGAGVLV